MKYGKLAAIVLATVLSAVLAVVTAGGALTAVVWVNAALLGVGSVAVFLKSNTVAWPYAKTAVAVATAVLTVVASALLTGGITTPVVLQIVLAALGAVGVYATPATELPGGLSPKRV